MNRTSVTAILFGIIILAWVLGIPTTEAPALAQAETIPAEHFRAYFPVLVRVIGGEQPAAPVTPVLDIPVLTETPEPVDIPEPTPTPEPVDTCPGNGYCWGEPGPHPSPAAPWADPTPEPEQPGQQNQNQKGGQG